MNTDEATFTDTERLEWVMKSHYAFREIYFWCGATSVPNLRVFREKIDEQLRDIKQKQTERTK